MVALALTACGGGTPTPTGATSNFGTSFSQDVKVVGWTFGADDFTAGPLSGQLDANGSGKFTLNAINPLPTQSVGVSAALVPVTGCSTTGLAVTGDTTSFRVFSGFTISTAAGTFQNAVKLATAGVTTDSAGGEIYASGATGGDFYNVGQAVSVKGSNTCPDGTKVVYDVSLATGWNLVTTTYNGSNSWTIKNNTENGLDWRVLAVEAATGTLKGQGKLSQYEQRPQIH